MKRHRWMIFASIWFTLCVILAIESVFMDHYLTKRHENSATKHVISVYTEPKISEPIETITPMVERISIRKPRYGFTDDDIYLLAQLLCGDQSKDGDGEYDFDFDDPNKIDMNEVGKVLCVVMNRVRDSNEFPNTVRGVILQKGQFSTMPRNLSTTPSPIALTIVGDWCGRYDNYDTSVQIIPENHLYFTGTGKNNVTSTHP